MLHVALQNNIHARHVTDSYVLNQQHEYLMFGRKSYTHYFQPIVEQINKLAFFMIAILRSATYNQMGKGFIKYCTFYLHKNKTIRG